MCITAQVSHASNTLLYVGEATRNEKKVHVIAYQNSAQSEGANAMILPFPAVEAMTEENIVDTRDFKNFLVNITEASRVKRDGRRLGGVARNMTKGGAVDSLALVFDSGSYTVVLAENVNQIPEALTRVPQNKRPQITQEFLEGYGKLYPNQPVAICCWEGELDAEPLLWWYVPKNPDVLFIPTMDAHDGAPPDVTAQVRVDHNISVGSTDESRLGPQKNEVLYKDNLPDSVKELLPKHVYGKKFAYRLQNGDMFVNPNKMEKFPDIARATSASDVTSVNFITQLAGWG